MPRSEPPKRARPQFVKPITDDTTPPAKSQSDTGRTSPGIQPSAKGKKIVRAQPVDQGRRASNMAVQKKRDDDIVNYASLLLDKGMPPKKVHQKLVEFKGLGSKDAAQIVNDLLSDSAANEDDLYEDVERLLDRGMSPKAIRRRLVEEKDVDPDLVDKILDELGESGKAPARKKKKKKKSSGSGSNVGPAIWHMVIGAGICCLGIGATIWSYNAALEGSGRYYLFGGAILGGAIQFIRGFILLFA